MRLSGADRSETARRVTNLFIDPAFIEHGAFLERGLAHRTARGELVRSKSEVIVADLLDGLNLPYTYEQPFTAPDGSVRYPDFTVDDAETGRRVLIEHLGMLDKPEYAERWQRKLTWYRAAGVRPYEEGEAEISLVTTSELGGFDATLIKARISSVFGL